MLYKNALCEHCKQETTHSSYWSGDPFKCKNCNRRKIFDTRTYQCKRCNKDVEYDAATCTFVITQKDGTTKLVTKAESDHCFECDNEIDP